MGSSGRKKLNETAHRHVHKNENRAARVSPRRCDDEAVELESAASRACADSRAWRTAHEAASSVSRHMARIDAILERVERTRRDKGQQPSASPVASLVSSRITASISAERRRRLGGIVRTLSSTSRALCVAAAIVAAALILGGAYFVGYVGEIQRDLNDPGSLRRQATTESAPSKKHWVTVASSRPIATTRLTGDAAARPQLTRRQPTQSAR